MDRWRRRLAGLVGLGITLWALLAVGLDAYGQRRSEGRFDAIVVAGCRVEPDGRPSLALQRRTRAAVSLWRQGAAPRLVFTGGVGTFPPSEARAAGDYALSLGVPADALVLEERSTSTEENARFAADLLGSSARVIVVTDTYHIFRAERVFGRFFAEASGTGSVAAPDVRARGALREVLAVSVYALTRRL